MRAAYSRVLRRRDVLAALVPYLLARLPLSMSSLALLVFVRAHTGSYGRAGLVCAAYGAAVAVGAPALGRLVDRHGQSRVLLVCGLVHPAAMVAVALLTLSAPFPAVVIAAVVAGLSLPPVSACMRVLWTRLLDERQRQTGFALEGLIVEVAELTGPLLVSAALLLGRPRTAVFLSAAFTGVGTLLFRMSGASRSAPVSAPSTQWWGALAHRSVRRLLLIVLTSTATISAVEVGVAAYARQHGGQGATGLYVAVISAGGVVAGLLAGAGVWATGRRRTLVLDVTLLASAVTAAAIAFVHGVPVVLLMLFVFGAAVAVSVVVQLAMMADAAPEEVRTEAFTWGGTANFAGLALGTFVAAFLVDERGPGAAFVVAAIPAVLAAIIATVSRGHLRQEGTVTAPPATAPEEAALRAEVAALHRRIAELESALLETAMRQTPEDAVLEDARQRAQRMLERADAACLEMRERAEDDAARVRAAATTAALEIMASAERDARATLAGARREADALLDRARRTEANRPAVPADPAAEAASSRPTLMAVPDWSVGAEGPVPRQETL